MNALPEVTTYFHAAVTSASYFSAIAFLAITTIVSVCVPLYISMKKGE